ncbi:hypothetical protein KC887_00030 [Candidatus Kaiserbacteria bacterium]|nr:hypothetical protein [Candidatus Kaiserbacteria bacterium]
MTSEEIQQNLLTLGLTAASAVDDVRATLTQARYTNDEIETAISILQTSSQPVSAPPQASPIVTQNSPTNERVSASRKLFRTQQALQPHEIQQLLGVEVAIDTRLVEIERRGDYLSTLQYLAVWFFSVVIAVSGIMFYMYVNHVGFFHEQVGIAKIR